MTDELHIVRLILDRRALMRIAMRHRLPQSVDEGYVIHAGLAQLFAQSSDPARTPLHTFALDDALAETALRADRVHLLAYSDLDEGSLLAQMAAPHRDLVLRCATRPVPMLPPDEWAAFRVRVCPVVRTKQPGDRTPRRDAKGRARSREVDAWLHHRFQDWQPEPPKRDGRPFERGEKSGPSGSASTPSGLSASWHVTAQPNSMTVRRSTASLAWCCTARAIPTRAGGSVWSDRTRC